jgi:DNA-binding transcriptional LysR family regulator
MKLFCTPRYVIQNGLPSTLGELNNLDIITGLENERLSFNQINSMFLINKYTLEKEFLTINQSSIRTNSASHAKKIGMSTDMIFACWESLCEKEVINGRLIPVLPEYDIPISSTFYLIHKQELSYEAKMFCDFINKCMAKSLSINYLTDVINSKF